MVRWQLRQRSCMAMHVSDAMQCRPLPVAFGVHPQTAARCALAVHYPTGTRNLILGNMASNIMLRSHEQSVWCMISHEGLSCQRRREYVASGGHSL